MAGAAPAEPDFAGTLKACMDAPFSEGTSAEYRSASREAWRETARALGWVTIADISEARDMPSVAEKATKSDMTVEAYLEFMDEAGFAIADQDLMDSMIPLSRLIRVFPSGGIEGQDQFESYMSQALEADRADDTIFSMHLDGKHIFLSGRDVISVLSVSESHAKRECILATIAPGSVLEDAQLMPGLNADFVVEDAGASEFFDLQKVSHVPRSSRLERALQLVWSSDGLARFPKLSSDAGAILLLSTRPEG